MNGFHRVVATLLLAGGLGGWAVGLPASAASTAPVAEAWYQHSPVDAQVSPLCAAGIPGPGCSGDALGAARGSAYPEQTLHVSVGNGFVDTSTVLELERPPAGSTKSLTLELPVAPEADGTTNATSARLQVCLASGEVEDGAEAAPPAEAPVADCSVASRALPRFGEDDAIVFVADLGPLVSATADGPLVVAIVPTEAALSESDEWHLAFSARDRGEVSAPGIAVVAPEPSPGPSEQPAPTPTPGPAPVTRPATGPLFPPPVAIPAPGAAEPAAPAPEVAPAAPVEAAAGAQPVDRRVVFPVGLIHPGVFAVPLALVVFGGLLGIGLARPLPLDDHTSPASSEPVAAVQSARAGSAPSVRLQGARK